MGSYYEGSDLQAGKGFAMASYVHGINAVQGAGQIRVILCAALFPRRGDLVVCTDSQLIYVLQAGIFARRQPIPFDKIEVLELNGRSIHVAFLGREDPKPPKPGEPEPPPAPHEVLMEETISIFCAKADLLQLYEHIQRRWRASGAVAALEQDGQGTGNSEQ